jgi:alpha-beta hydrolase superfamily lysophospholipase
MRTPFALACLLTLVACASGESDEAPAGTESAVGVPQIPLDPCPSERQAVPGMTTGVRSSFGSAIRTGSMGTGNRGDVLFLHGFADRFDNHLPLFDAFVKSGLRVITFDYPSHGESCGFRIDTFAFTGLARLAADVLKETRADKNRPLYIAGWSTGGLLAVRIAQGLEKERFDKIAGLALFAPGVDVQTFSPALTGVTNATLTRNPNPPHLGPIRPSNVFEVGAFAVQLMTNEQLAQHKNETFPADIPTLVFTGGDNEDQYASSPGVEDWVRQRRASDGANITGLKCAGGFHELDNEPEPMGGAVRAAAASFLANSNRAAPEGGGCTKF